MSTKPNVMPFLLIAGNTLSYTVLFMTVSVMSLYLNDKLFSFKQIGVAVGVVSLVSSCFGMISWKVSKVFGLRFSITSGIFLSGVGYFFVVYSSSFKILLLTCFLIGVARSVYEPSMKAMMSKYAFSGRPDLMYRLRYLSICVGAFVGPLGAVLFKEKSNAILTTAVLLIFYSFLFYALCVKDEDKILTNEKTNGLTSHWKPVLKNQNLLLLVISGGSAFLILSLFESILPLSLKPFFDAPSETFSIFLISNAVFSFSLQYPAIKLTKFFSTGTLAMAGCFLFSGAFLTFSVAQSSTPWWIMGVFLFSCGEALTLPASDIMIDKIAPEDLKTAYFGFAELRQLGFFFGPFAGAFILDELGPTTLYLGAAAFIFLISFLYYKTSIKVESYWPAEI